MKNKSILKNNSTTRSSVSLSPSTSISSLNLTKPTESTTNEKSDASVLVSANSAKNKKTEGYEILVSPLGNCLVFYC